MKTVLAFLLVIMSFINVGLFIFWLSLVHVEMSGKDTGRYIYDNTATNLTILQVVFALVLVGTSIIATFWYYSVKLSVNVSASKTVDDYIKQNGHTIIKQYIKESTKTSNG